MSKKCYSTTALCFGSGFQKSSKKQTNPKDTALIEFLQVSRFTDESLSDTFGFELLLCCYLPKEAHWGWGGRGGRGHTRVLLKTCQSSSMHNYSTRYLKWRQIHWRKSSNENENKFFTNSFIFPQKSSNAIRFNHRQTRIIIPTFIFIRFKIKLYCHFAVYWRLSLTNSGEMEAFL